MKQRFGEPQRTIYPYCNESLASNLGAQIPMKVRFNMKGRPHLLLTCFSIATSALDARKGLWCWIDLLSLS